MEKTCVKCGRAFEGDGNLCETCQNNNSAETKQDSQSNDSTKKGINNNTIILIAFVLVSCYFLFGGVFSNGSAKDLTSNPVIATGFTLGKYRAKSGYVTGTVNDKKWEVDNTKIAIEITFYDKKKSKLDTRYDYSPSLNKGDSWSFSVIIPKDAAYYKIDRVAFIVD